VNQAAATSGNSAGWPWGENKPTPRRRLIVSAAIALVSCVVFYVIHFANPSAGPDSPMHSDFSLIWYGAEFIRSGQNPYELIGPGLQIESQWNALYPATAYVLAIPLTLLGEKWASVVFAGLSSFLLVFGATRGSWHRLPMFASAAFITGMILGQISVLMAAILFLPLLAVVSCAKPQVALPLVITSRRRLLIAGAGGLVVLALTLVLLPGWPGQWFSLVQASSHLRPPIVNFGGPLIMLVLLRWRRPEAWIIAVMALMPQTWYPYNWIVLLALADNYREAGIISIFSSIGALAGEYAVYGLSTAEVSRIGGAFAVAFAFLPATLMVLRRPNVRPDSRLS
jgi:hypothetical protein